MYKYKMNPFIKLICLILLLLIIFFSKNLLLYIFLGILSIVLVLMSDISVKKYIDFTKKIILWLIFIMFMFIIIFGKVHIQTIYKFFIVLIIIETYILTNTFEDFEYAINCILKPLKYFKIDICCVSKNITFLIMYVYYFINVKKTNDSFKSKNILYYPKYLLSRVLIANDKVENLKLSLKLKFYKTRKYNLIYKDIIVISIMIFVFVAVLFKEVFI